MSDDQSDLFGETQQPALPAGLRLAEGFLSLAEERALIERFAALPLQNAEYLQYTARHK